ncbi:MAG TPA: hypothetical protein VN698_16065 [Bacteroidia bacterium]|nr:hypothetical protein [Bacteroidia bacterium]
MGRKTIDEQYEIRQAFLKRLNQSEQTIFMRIQLFLRGDIKKKFISDLKKEEQSINKLANQIFKSYYEKRK